jgi:hypothetical protein
MLATPRILSSRRRSRRQKTRSISQTRPQREAAEMIV